MTVPSAHRPHTLVAASTVAGPWTPATEDHARLAAATARFIAGNRDGTCKPTCLPPANPPACPPPPASRSQAGRALPRETGPERESGRHRRHLSHHPLARPRPPGAAAALPATSASHRLAKGCGFTAEHHTAASRRERCGSRRICLCKCELPAAHYQSWGTLAGSLPPSTPLPGDFGPIASVSPGTS